MCALVGREEGGRGCWRVPRTELLFQVRSRSCPVQGKALEPLCYAPGLPLPARSTSHQTLQVLRAKGIWKTRVFTGSKASWRSPPEERGHYFDHVHLCQHISVSLKLVFKPGAYKLSPLPIFHRPDNQTPVRLSQSPDSK